jgi:hypothetical protein
MQHLVNPQLQFNKIDNYMKHVTNFTGWKTSNNINESLILTLQVGVILGILGWKGLRALIRKVAEKIGGKTELDKAQLKEIIDETIDAIAKLNPSEINLSAIRSELKGRVEAEEIKTINDIEKSFKELSK